MSQRRPWVSQTQVLKKKLTTTLPAQPSLGFRLQKGCQKAAIWQIGADFQAFSTSNSISRCDMMFAMFSHNDFREKVTNVVHFPGISKLTFGQLLHYLYTDRVTSDRATSGLSTSSIFNWVSAFCNKKIIDLPEGQINGLMCRGNAFLFCSSQQLPRLCLRPLKGFLSWHGALQGPSTLLVRCSRNYRDSKTPSGVAR